MEFGSKYPVIDPELTVAVDAMMYEDVPVKKALDDAEKRAKEELR